MSIQLYAVPDCIKEKCDQGQYRKWLQRKATAHVKRDRKRFGKELRVSQYKAAIHAAICGGGERDYYTGELLHWHLVSTYRNAESTAGKAKYKSSFALLPTVDHTVDKHGQQKFVICSWRVNDAKSDLTEPEFLDLCEKVLRHRSSLLSRSAAVP